MVTVFYNPSCSTCRNAKALLEDNGVKATYREYLKDTPSRAELEEVLAMLGSDDPRAIVRKKEPLYQELGLETASKEALLAAMVKHPRLIERPIVIVDDCAVVARPIEKVLPLIGK